MWGPTSSLTGWLFKKYSVRGKISKGWHERFFVLKVYRTQQHYEKFARQAKHIFFYGLQGNRLEYFLDSRKKRVKGYVLLGPDCRIECSETSTSGGKRFDHFKKQFTTN